VTLRGLALAVWLAPAAAAQPPSGAVRAPRSVAIAGFAFAPAELEVVIGDTVVWSNTDRFAHTTAADSGAWSSPELSHGGSFRFAPSRAGRYWYRCTLHPVMRGVLVVKDDGYFLRD
jgi:plastocyanin